MSQRTEYVVIDWLGDSTSFSSLNEAIAEVERQRKETETDEEIRVVKHETSTVLTTKGSLAPHRWASEDPSNVTPIHALFPEVRVKRGGIKFRRNS